MFKWLKRLFTPKTYTAVTVTNDEVTDPAMLLMLNRAITTGELVIGNRIDDNTIEISDKNGKRIEKI
jgi:hypothetical protein